VSSADRSGAPVSGEDPDAVARRILDNPELVATILASAGQLSPPMSLAEFLAWLERDGQCQCQRASAPAP